MIGLLITCPTMRLGNLTMIELGHHLKATSEPDYSGELTVVAIFETLENFGSQGSDDTFNNANIV
jgi:hypothetical protein